MFNLNKFLQINLLNYVNDSLIQKIADFNYGTVTLKCEHFGYNILFFQSFCSGNKTSGISLENINDSPKTSQIINQIIKDIELDLKIGDSEEEMLNLFGKPFSQDRLLEDTTRYNFFVKVDNTEFFICLGIHDTKGLYMIELISDLDILNGIKNDGWRNF